jgi:AcrR family transcriptional regulator
MSAVDVAPTHRERKKLATRRALHLGALDLVEQHGLSGATVEAISERAGVAPRTFWAYFSSKEQAVLDHDPDRPESLRLALLARPLDEAPLIALQRVLEEDLDRRVVDQDEAIRRYNLLRSEPHLMSAVAANFEQIERALVSAIAERTGLDPDADIYPGVLVSAACGACRVAQLRWSGQRGRPSLVALVQEAFDELAGGLLPPPPARRPTNRGRR